MNIYKRLTATLNSLRYVTGLLALAWLAGSIMALTGCGAGGAETFGAPPSISGAAAPGDDSATAPEEPSPRLAAPSQPEPLVLHPVVDAQVWVNFDGVPHYCSVDPNNDWLTVLVRMAATDRNDPWRPAFGVIEEGRPAMEFAISSLVASNPGGVRQATLRLYPQALIHYDNEYPYTTVMVNVGCYAGDGQIDGLVEGSAANDFPRATLPTEFDPTPIQWTGTPYTFDGSNSSGTPFNVDVTLLVNSLILKSAGWAGFSLDLDNSTIPLRSTLEAWSAAVEGRSWDHTVGVGFRAYNLANEDGPALIVDTAPALPANMVHTTEVLLTEQVTSGAVPAAAAAPLVDLLESASVKIAEGHATPAKNKLNSFIKEVVSLIKDGIIASSAGQVLINGAQAAINGLPQG